MKKKAEKQIEILTCGECAEGEICTDFHTLSIKGEPTMKRCPYTSHMRLLSERVKNCRNVRKRNNGNKR